MPEIPKVKRFLFTGTAYEFDGSDTDYGYVHNSDYSALEKKLSEHEKWREETIDKLQDICKQHGCPGGYNRLDFLREYPELLKKRASLAEQKLAASEALLKEAMERLLKYDVVMSYDYPGDAPVECGFWCDLCKEHIEDGAGHRPGCLHARYRAYINPTQAAEEGKS